MEVKILLDLNDSIFQEQLFKIEKLEQRAFLNSLSKIKKLTWNELHKDKGLRWELIKNKKDPKDSHLYSFRFSRKYRATAYRKGGYLVLVEIFTDHDSAYR